MYHNFEFFLTEKGRIILNFNIIKLALYIHYMLQVAQYMYVLR